MPLDEYITETMTLLQTQPEADEIVVERVKGFRFAERDGAFDDIYPAFNQNDDRGEGRVRNIDAGVDGRGNWASCPLGIA